jgi:hypothetical protein
MGGALAAILTRMVRTSMLEELGQDYIRTARAKGLPERTVVYRHALRNAMIPILTVLGLQFGALLAGAIVTETIFSWPGIGRLTIQAIANRDYYLVQGCILAIGLTYVAVNFLTDLLYSAVNPRMWYERHQYQTANSLTIKPTQSAPAAPPKPPLGPNSTERDVAPQKSGVCGHETYCCKACFPVLQTKQWTRLSAPTRASMT